MRAAHRVSTEARPETTDQSALRLMLSYVEAECLRMGATDAARHAALAASLMPARAQVDDRHDAAPPVTAGRAGPAALRRRAGPPGPATSDGGPALRQ